MSILRISVAKSAPGRTNTNVLDVRPIRVTLLDDLAQPLVGVRYQLSAGGISMSGTTDDMGAVRAVVPPGTREATLEYWPLPEDEGPPEVLELEIGEIAPVSSLRGAQVRLEALGFDCGEEELLTETMSEALRGFQDLVGLPITGAMDTETLKMLDELYGDPS
ncbi:MAG: peptidoglycan-binding domain-containing protein [Byssovorax sp.]